MNTTSNRRREERLNKALPVFVRAQNAQGQRLKITTTTENISQGGLFMLLPDLLLPAGSLLFTLTHMPSSAGLAAIGKVVRAENQGLGLMGLAVCFSQTRLLPLPN
jgi:hypothetical protein